MTSTRWTEDKAFRHEEDIECNYLNAEDAHAAQGSRDRVISLQSNQSFRSLLTC